MKKKKDFSNTIAFVLAILVLIIFIPINLIVSFYDKGFDMTPSKKYTLSDKTKQLIADNSDKHIDVYYLSKLAYFHEADASEFLPLYHTLTQLDEYDNITLTCFDPNENASLASQLDPEGNLGTKECDIFVKCNNVTKKISSAKIFQQSSKGEKQYAGEELLAAAISICSSGSLPTVYFLTGHGENSINDRFSIYANQLKSKDYDVQELDLDKTGVIPDNAKIIYLAGPQKDITDKERDLLNEYADNGGALSFLIDPCDTKGRFYNIENVMEKFGLILDYNYVTESLPGNMLHDRDEKQVENYFRVEYPAGSRYNDEFTQDLTSDLNELISEGAYIAGIANTRSLTEIPEDSFLGASYTERSSIIKNVIADSGEYTTVSKAMGGDDVTAQQANELLSGMSLDFGYYSYNKVSGGKLVVFGTTSIIDSDVIAPSLSGSTMLATFSNTWLYDSDIQFGVGNKFNSYDRMTFKDKNEATSVMVAVYVIPAILAVVGVSVWLKRRYS
jgi:hypothetical protein